MEAINFLSKRQINPDSVFSSSTELGDCDEDTTSLLKNLDHLLEKLLKTWWDVFTFKHYLKEKLIFKSLRWEVPPQDALTDPSFMKEWLDFFNKAGLELQDLVLTRKEFKFTKINEQIKDIERKLEPIKGTNSILEFNNNMKKKLEKLDREVQKKKVKKYIRDSTDFKNNKIYAWQNSGVGVEPMELNNTEGVAPISSSGNQLEKSIGKKNGKGKIEQHTPGHPRRGSQAQYGGGDCNGNL